MEGFTWRDGERTIRFRDGSLNAAPELLAEHGWNGFELLSTPRALSCAPDGLRSAATEVHEVAPGPVPEAAARIMGSGAKSNLLVAFGGGRVIDSAKAIAAVTGATVCAIPTTLSGAEMTAIHRLPAGREAEARSLVRPALVLADPLAMTSQPEPELRASAMNALAHGADSLYTPFANPVAGMAALRGAELIAAALDTDREEREPAGLGLGSLLGAYALDSALFALHHVLCQTLVRVVGTPHAETNAAMLPRTIEAVRPRAPGPIAELAAALGTDSGEIGARIEELGGGRRRLSELGADGDRLEQALDAAAARPELGFTPDPPDRAELAEIVEAAW